MSSVFISQKIVAFIAKSGEEDLGILKDLIEAGKVKPVIDRRYKLRDIADAIGYLKEGHARAKVVITM